MGWAGTDTDCGQRCCCCCCLVVAEAAVVVTVVVGIGPRTEGRKRVGALIPCGLSEREGARGWAGIVPSMGPPYLWAATR